MTAKQAYSILLSKNPAVNAIKCYEYDSMFVFHLSPAMLRLSKNSSPMLDGLLSVNKKTGQVRDFKPFYISIEEYTDGVEVASAKWK